MPNPIVPFRPTPRQEACYEAVRWLLDDQHRAEGRTTLVAYAWVRKALETPGRRVLPVDLSPIPERYRGHQQDYFIGLICGIADGYGLRYEYRMSDRSFTITGVKHDATPEQREALNALR